MAWLFLFVFPNCGLLYKMYADANEIPLNGGYAIKHLGRTAVSCLNWLEMQAEEIADYPKGLKGPLKGTIVGLTPHFRSSATPHFCTRTLTVEDCIVPTGPIQGRIPDLRSIEGEAGAYGVEA